MSGGPRPRARPAAQLPATLPLPRAHARLLNIYTHFDGLVCFLVKQRLGCSLQSVLSLASGAFSLDDVRCLLAAAPAGLISVRPMPAAASSTAVFDRAGNWGRPHGSEGGGSSARPLMHIAAPLPDLPDIDLDEDDATKPFVAAAPRAALPGGWAAPATVPAAAASSIPNLTVPAAAASSAAPVPGGGLDQLLVTLEPPGVGKPAAAARRAAVHQALLRHVAAAQAAFCAAAAAAADATLLQPALPPANSASSGSSATKQPAKRACGSARGSSSGGGGASGGSGSALSTPAAPAGASTAATVAAAAVTQQSSWTPGFDLERDVPPLAPAELAVSSAQLPAAAHAPSAAAASSSAHSSALLLGPVVTPAPPATAAAGEPAGATSINDLEALLRRAPWYAGQLVHSELRPRRAVAFAALPPAAHAAVPQCVWGALAAQGITRLFSHQAAAIAASLAGRDVVLTTPTSSGKSVAFHVPAFAALLADPAAVVVYVFPTKALAQDQLRALRELLGGAPPELAAAVRPATLDGDTPLTERQALKSPGGPNLLLVNPDILHASVLPGHAGWRRLLCGLALLVVDEAHVYRGIFGGHVALTLRRLLRLVALYGAAKPRVVLASATIANPAGLLRALIPALSQDAWAALGGARAPTGSRAGAGGDEEAAVAVIGAEQDGSGCGARQFIVWNPPLLPHRAAGIAAGTASADVLPELEPGGGGRLALQEAGADPDRPLQEGGHCAPAAAAAAPGAAAGARPSVKRKRRRDASHHSAPVLSAAPASLEDEPLTPGLAASNLTRVRTELLAAMDAVCEQQAPGALDWDGGSRGNDDDDCDDRGSGGGAALPTDATGCVIVKPNAYFATATAAVAAPGSPLRAAQRSRSAARPAASVTASASSASSASAAEWGAEQEALRRLEGARRGPPPINASPGAYRRSVRSGPYALARAARGGEASPSRLPPASGDGSSSMTACPPHESSSSMTACPPHESSSSMTACPPHESSSSTPRHRGALEGAARDDSAPSPPPLPKWVQRYLRQQHPYAAPADGDGGSEPAGRRRSPIVETAMLTAELVRCGLRTLVFCRVRRVAELLLQYTHERLAKQQSVADGDGAVERAVGSDCASSAAASSVAAARLIDRVKSYRGGYLKEHRRAVEADLFAGRLLAVVATNALELGVDIGSLDVVVMLGYPGSAASLWQQAGRAGRRGKDAAAILVPYASPLDQAFVRWPAELLRRPVEAVACDPCNPVLLRLHATAAAAESALRPVDMALFGPALGDAVVALRGAKMLLQADARGLAGDAGELQRLLCGSSGGGGGGAGGGGGGDASPTSSGAFLVGGGSGSSSGASGTELPIDRGDDDGDDGDGDDDNDRCFRLLVGGAHRTAAAHPHALRAATVGGRDLGALHGWRLAAWVDAPARAFSLRAVDDVTYDVVVSGGRVIDRMEETRVLWELHEGAIVLHAGATYRVTQLDTRARVVHAAPCAVAYYTEPRKHNEANALARTRSSPNGLVHLGPAQVVGTVFGYHKLWRRTGLPFESVELASPPLLYETLALWGDVPLATKDWLDRRGLDFLGGCHGAAHAVLACLPLHVCCEPADLGTECPSPQQRRARPLRFIVFEAHPGGVGLLAAGWAAVVPLLRDALALVEGCACDDGCVRCIQHAGCKQYNAVLDKAASVAVLRSVQSLPLEPASQPTVAPS